MERRKPSVTKNSNLPQKRGWEIPPHQERPSKKYRTQNGHVAKSSAIALNVLPRNPPKLPPISAEYEEIVFTHPGAAPSSYDDEQMVNYDRLEFLGDAYLEIIATRLIFHNYKSTNAGGMCRLREAVVKNETLSKYSIMYGFDKKLRMTEAINDGQKGWNKVYGDVFEAFAAAVVLSDPKGGEAKLEAWLRELWKPVLQQVELPQISIDAKQELAKKIHYVGVKINYVDERPPIVHKGEGRESFFVGVYLDGWGWKNQHLGSGQGFSKVIAGSRAASSAMENHPLIDEIVAKRSAFLKEKEEEKEREKEKKSQTNEALER